MLWLNITSNDIMLLFVMLLLFADNTTVHFHYHYHRPKPPAPAVQGTYSLGTEVESLSAMSS